MSGGVRWIDAPEAAGAGDLPVAWLLRWDDPRVDGWLSRSAPDRADLARFAGRADAGRRIVRRRLARLLLATVGNCRADAVRLDDAAGGGVAVAVPAGWHVSLAGGGGWCAVATGPAPLGIDIEPVAGDPLPGDLLTVAERGRIAAMPAHGRLAASLACWAGKEAHAKRLGRPREADPAAIDVLVTGAVGLARSAAGTSRLAFRYGEGRIAAVALAAGDDATARGGSSDPAR